jgi:lysophospholipase L1-like esterase
MATWLIALALAAPGWQEAPPPHLELKDGDRVAILGDALAESMQEDGELELLLTARFPEANVRFRNLAFAGDTVWGDALAAFDTVEDGYKRRLELVRKVEPTVVFLAFGANESWEGEKGLDRFIRGYDRLLDDLKALNPREVVLMAPLPQENLGPPFPDPAEHNLEVARYAAAIRSLAARRGLRFVEPASGPASN